MLADLCRYRRYTTLRVTSSFLVRIHPFLQILTFIIPIVAQIMFWKAVYGGANADIGGYNVSDMVLYLIVIRLVDNLTGVHEGGIQEDIRFGALTEYLLKPASYIAIQYFEQIGHKVTRVMNLIILIVLVYAFYIQDVHLTADIWVYPAGAVSIFLGFHLHFAFKLCLAFLSFWVEGQALTSTLDLSRSKAPCINQRATKFLNAVNPTTFLPPRV